MAAPARYEEESLLLYIGGFLLKLTSADSLWGFGTNKWGKGYFS